MLLKLQVAARFELNHCGPKLVMSTNGAWQFPARLGDRAEAQAIKEMHVSNAIPLPEPVLMWSLPQKCSPSCPSPDSVLRASPIPNSLYNSTSADGKDRKMSLEESQHLQWERLRGMV